MARVNEADPTEVELNGSLREDSPDLVARRLSRRRTSLFQPSDIAPAAHSHRIPGTQYFALAVWIVLLLLAYGWTRFICLFGIPHDCTDNSDFAEVMHDMEYLLFAGVVLAVLTGVHWPDRFQYIFSFKDRCPRGVLFLTCLFTTELVWGLFDLLPGLTEFSLTAGLSGPYLLLLFVLVAGAFLVGAWHIWVAWKHNSKSGFAAYVLSRCGIVAFYGAHIVLLPANEDVSFHFHHYVIGYIAASMAEFNHPASVILLAVGTGIFVQGISAYDADPIVKKNRVRVVWTEADGTKMSSPKVSVEAADFFIEHCRFVSDFFRVV